MNGQIEKQILDMQLSNNKGNISDDDDSVNEDTQRKYNELIIKGKKLVGEGKIAEALEMNKSALQLCYNEKLAKKIKKMEDYLAAHGDESDEEDDGMLHLGKGFYIYKDLYKSLYMHQQEGVLWLWSLFRRKKGGILGDDMGLGKTIQVIGFLSGMFDMQKIKSVLIVLPVAVMVNWENEFQKWAPGLKVVAYHGNSKREKMRALARVQKRGGVLLTTYGLVVTSWEQLGHQDHREFVWDYMILDEGHKIKNPTKTSKGVHAIPARNRIILTGTPVQNNLKELWSLFDFVHQGTLLGNQKTFKMAYENPITQAREKDATIGEKKLGMEMADSLKKIIAPYFLRRTKAEVNQKEKDEKEEPDETDSHAIMPTMTRKNDLIVWTFLRDAQLKIYQDFLSLDSVKELLMTSKSPLVALTVLKKICDHPRQLSTRACSQLGIEHDEGLDEDILETEEGNLPAVTRIKHISDDVLINESGKLLFLVQLLDRLKEEGHRCLVFSQSRKMLDIMQKVITNRGHKVMRLDGTIAQVQEREQRIKKFQSDSKYSVFLLTTQVGGVGLTLTAADRVVIFDPSWNPAVDAQAVDRVFRIGQDKNVVVYRLITCGTVEEKIYRRQIFKDSITRQTTGNAKNPHRYFSKYELRELFVLDNPRTSTTQEQLEQMHSGQRLTDPGLDEHIAFLYSLEIFGLSDHDLMFSHGNEAGDEQDHDEGENVHPENDYIQHQVQKAREIIQMESSQPSTLDERLGKNSQVGSGAIRNQFTNWDFPRPTVPEENNDGEEEEEAGSEEYESVDSDEPVELEPTSSPTPDMKFGVKQEPNYYIDLTSPVVKKEPELHQSIHETPIRMKKEPVINSMSGSPYIQQMDIDSPKVKREPDVYDDHNAMELGTPDHRSYMDNAVATESGASPQRYNRTTTPKSIRQSITYTPKKDKSIVNEEILISPDASRPIVQTRQPSGTNLSILSASDFRPKFNSTVLKGSHIADNCNESLGAGISPALSEGTFFQDSPVEKPENARHPFKIIVEDSPLVQQKKNGENNGDVSIVEESVIIDDSVVISDDEEKENMEPGGILVNDLQNILEKSLNHNTSINEANISISDSPIEKKSRRKSSAYKRPIVESSDDTDEELMNDVSEDNELVENDLNDFESSVHDGIEEVTDDEAELPDLSVERVENSDKFENSVNASVDDGAENDEDSHENDADNCENESSDMDLGDEVDNSENEYSEYEEDEELQGFEALPEDEQIRYNELVERGRALCAAKQYEDGQVCVLQALEIFPDQELQGTCMAIQRKIMKLKQKAQQMNS